jgi:hypothetical protein
LASNRPLVVFSFYSCRMKRCDFVTDCYFYILLHVILLCLQAFNDCFALNSICFGAFCDCFLLFWVASCHSRFASGHYGIISCNLYVPQYFFGFLMVFKGCSPLEQFSKILLIQQKPTRYSRLLISKSHRKTYTG